MSMNRVASVASKTRLVSSGSAGDYGIPWFRSSPGVGAMSLEVWKEVAHCWGRESRM